MCQDRGAQSRSKEEFSYQSPSLQLFSPTRSKRDYETPPPGGSWLRFKEAWSLLTLNVKLCVSMHIKKEKKNLGKAYVTSMRFDTGEKKKNYFFDMKNFLSIER